MFIVSQLAPPPFSGQTNFKSNYERTKTWMNISTIRTTWNDRNHLWGTFFRGNFYHSAHIGSCFFLFRSITHFDQLTLAGMEQRPISCFLSFFRSDVDRQRLLFAFLSQSLIKIGVSDTLRKADGGFPSGLFSRRCRFWYFTALNHELHDFKEIMRTAVEQSDHLAASVGTAAAAAAAMRAALSRQPATSWNNSWPAHCPEL